MIRCFAFVERDPPPLEKAKELRCYGIG